MTPTTRNLLGVGAGVVAGYVALAVAATVDYAIHSSGSFEPGIGELLFRLAIVWPHLLSATVLGLVTGAIVDARSSRLWMFVVAALAAAQNILSIYYVSPDLAERLKTIAGIVLIAAVAAGVFSLVVRLRRRPHVAQTAS